MADLLSHSKKKYIEKWRKSVGIYLKNGDLCKVTITDVPPDRDGSITPQSVKSGASYSPSPSLGSSGGYLPAIRQSRFQDATKNKYHDIRQARNGVYMRLPPSPNGMLVHNQPQINASWVINTTQTIENNFAVIKNGPELTESMKLKAIGRKSSKLAKEIFDKYNMKSESQNMLPGKHMYNGFQQFSMPWRNKTFLTIPLSYNSSNRLKNRNQLESDHISISSMNVSFSSNGSMDTSDSRSEFDVWEGEE